jgi:hypothetical protein
VCSTAMAPGVPCNCRSFWLKRSTVSQAQRIKRIEDDVGVGQSEPAPFGRQREGQQKVVGRDQALHLTFQPLLALVVLAVRAKAMAAGMRDEVVVRTVTALNLHHRTGRAAAMLDRRQRLKLVKAQPVAKLRRKSASNSAMTEPRRIIGASPWPGDSGPSAR